MGFTFNNIHSSEFALGFSSTNRSLLPTKIRNEFLVPGKHGRLDYGNETYDNRIITIEIRFIGINKNFETLRIKSRDIARWLSGEGLLVFDDEPDKAYKAKIYSQVDIEQLDRIGRCMVDFECQPFAESLEYRQVNIPSITTKPYEIPLNVSGTSETCPIITIKNIGTTNINNITIVRKAEV